jgi:ubiquinone/menaquinone biosynthesis C-methylase UbiE
MPTSPAAFDFGDLASHFDRFLPQIHPVTLALLDHLPALAASQTVLDVACGTGEPGLTLARRSPAVQLVGVDQLETMIAVAQAKAARDALANARFSAMAMDALALPDASVDAVISRFGLLMFGDVSASARELARVLRVGGCYCLAAWDDPARNTLVNTHLAVLRPHLPPGRLAAFEALSEWAEPGRRATLLQGLGLGPVQTEMFSWSYRFESFEEAWDMLSGMGKLTGQADLTLEVQEHIRTALCVALEQYRQQGEYIIPQACRLFWGARLPR